MYAQVAVARPVPGPLTYAIPAALAGAVRVGHVVLVPLGARGQETGYVVGHTDTIDFDPAKVRPISRLVDPEPAFDARQLAFFRWLADYYLAPLGEVIRTALPSEVQARVVGVLVPTDDGIEALTRGEVAGEAAQVLREVVSRPGLTRKGLVRRLDAELEAEPADRAIDALLRRGFVAWSERELKETRGRIAVATRTAAPRPDRLGRRMAAVLEAVADARELDVRELAAAQGESARPALKKLVELGLVAITEREDRAVSLDAAPLGAATPPVLNNDQKAALAALCAPDAAGAWLLFGVTGSGKTEVFLGAAKAALDRGKQVLVLVPEIGLTPQLVGRFRARFGDAVAVLHSGLSGGERLAQWRRIRAGEARVAVGARSALFAPFRDLGLVVVDEEHDDSYKQDDGVRYNARDGAVVLGRMSGCPVVLASATPSLETWHNAETGRYRLLRLPRRATPRPVPRVEIVDLSELEPPAGPDGEPGPRPLLAPEVEAAVRGALDDGGQAIVLYNRRGFATMVQCTACGATYECPNCGITMTLHARARVVACHYCGLKRHYDGVCPACHRPDLEELGKGTERIEETLAGRFPGVGIARMDADTTAVRGAHHRILETFRTGKARLLVGTQIVAKGHDFPDVQVAVVVSADLGFRLPDFRSAERTYAMLVQVAGRAGRGERPGRVYVQTWNADHYALAHLDDVEGFFRAEARLRRTLRYPPFARLVLVRLEGVDRQQVTAQAGELARDLRALCGRFPGTDVLGPAAAALPKLVGRWRFQIVLRGTDVRPFRAFLDAARPRLEAPTRRGVRRTVDVDPRSLM